MIAKEVNKPFRVKLITKKISLEIFFCPNICTFSRLKCIPKNQPHPIKSQTAIGFFWVTPNFEVPLHAYTTSVALIN